MSAVKDIRPLPVYDPRSLEAQKSDRLMQIWEKSQKIPTTYIPDARKIEIYDPTSGGQLPGLFGIVTMPYVAALTIQRLFKAIHRRDFATASDLVMTAMQVPLCLSYSAARIASYLINVTTSITLFIIPLTLTASLSLIGALICGIEFIIQAGWVHHTYKFQKQFSFDKESVLEDLTYLREQYFTLSEAESCKITQRAGGDARKREKLIIKAQKKKYEKLALMVRPWLAEELFQKIPAILDNPTEANLQRGAELLADVKVQIKKRYAILAISFAMIALSFTSMMLLPFTGMPILFAASVIAVILTTLMTLRYLLYEGTMDCKGWDFSIKNCIPEFLRQRLFS